MTRCGLEVIEKEETDHLTAWPLACLEFENRPSFLSLIKTGAIEEGSRDLANGLIRDYPNLKAQMFGGRDLMLPRQQLICLGRKLSPPHASGNEAN